VLLPAHAEGGELLLLLPWIALPIVLPLLLLLPQLLPLFLCFSQAQWLSCCSNARPITAEPHCSISLCRCCHAR
jgi:hypothetical protein